MLKIQAINLLGGNASDAASAMGVSYQAVNKWPDHLPDRIADRVLGVCVRRGIHVPAEFTEGGAAAATLIPTDHTIEIDAAAPLTTDAALEADLEKAEQAGLVHLPKRQAPWSGAERRVAQSPRRAIDRERTDIGAAGQGVA